MSIVSLPHKCGITGEQIPGGSKPCGECKQWQFDAQTSSCLRDFACFLIEKLWLDPTAYTDDPREFPQELVEAFERYLKYGNEANSVERHEV